MMGFVEAARRRRETITDSMRTRLWPVPAVGVVAAAIAGVMLPELDAAVAHQLPSETARFLFGGGADAAREVLSAIATSLITVTSLTFSLTLITLQLASSQYTPRLLRTFAADRFIQRTLALFLATFIYALTVLRTVRGGGGGVEFVPQIATTMAFLLAVASVFGLVFFLAHLVRQIRIETTLDHVAADAIATANRLLDRCEDSAGETDIRSPPPQCSVIESNSSGFLIEIDEEKLLAAAIDGRAVLWIDRAVGERVVAGVPTALCWPHQSEAALDDDTLDALRRRVARALRSGSERSAAQDIGYGLQQLSDVAVRALSPGINDPTTAVHGLNTCTEVLAELAGRRLGVRLLRDEHDEVRVVLAAPDLADLLDLVCTQPLHYGAHDPAVLTGLLSMLRDIGWRTSLPKHRHVILDWLDRLHRTIDQEKMDPVERARLEKAQRQVIEALDGRWTAG